MIPGLARDHDRLRTLPGSSGKWAREIAHGCEYQDAIAVRKSGTDGTGGAAVLWRG